MISLHNNCAKLMDIVNFLFCLFNDKLQNKLSIAQNNSQLIVLASHLEKVPGLCEQKKVHWFFPDNLFFSVPLFSLPCGNPSIKILIAALQTQSSFGNNNHV